MTSAEYFFLEWVICDKQMSEDEFENLSENEYKKLVDEYLDCYKYVFCES